MLVSITTVRELMAAACRAADVPKDGVDLVVEHYLDGQLRGRTAHGVAKFCVEARSFSQRHGSPQVVRQHGVLAVVDARREIGPLSAAFAVDHAIDIARTCGAGIVGTINTQRYGILASWSERIARAGLIGIVMNTSPAEATVPGARTPFLGVNPLSYAIPTSQEPLVVDMATTESPMGVLWERRRRGERLPAGCFVDADGLDTDDPDAAAAVLVFGGHRGFALSLLVQVMTGAMFGFPMSHDVEDTWTTGYAVVAMDPTVGGRLGEFEASTTRLVQAVAGVRRHEGGTVRVPGRASATRAAGAARAGVVDLDEAVLERLRTRAAGDFTSD